MGSIYLIRHGQASFGAEDYDVLSPLGVRQAQIVGQHLVDLGLRFDRCLSGDLSRQQDTARHALQQFSVAGLATPALEVDPAFNEFDAFGVLSALLPGLLPDEPNAVAALTHAAHDPAEFQRIFDLIVARWVSGTWDTPELESWLAFVERVQGGLNRLLDHARASQHTIAVFTSGGTITALLHLLTRIPASEAFKLTWHIANTSLSRLSFQGREVTLASFNSHLHLQLLKTPSLITYR
ncbi:histidine phosphatase family protein [Pseudomonas lundensis]|uniref:histidine phosphatase family protein n=1 Tax=Pseudomonas lundensis TaxID=86185 RepID=UPI0035242637